MAKMKKALALVMALSMSCSIFCLPTFAADETDDGVIDVDITIGDPTDTADVDESDEEGGSASFTKVNPPEGTVEVPEEPGESDTIVTGDPEGTTNTSGDTTETVVQQGSITVTNNGVEIKDESTAEGSDMENVTSDTAPDDTNDLVHAGDAAPEEYLPGYEGEKEPVGGSADDEYAYTYMGSGNTSKLVPAIVFTTPLSDADKVAQYGEEAYIRKNNITYYYVGCLTEEDKARLAYNEDGSYVTDENGFILDIDGNRVLKEERTAIGPDGETIYLHRFDNYNNSLNVEGWYDDGEWVKELNGKDAYTAIWAGPQQFVLVDDAGNVVTVYCADFSTPTQDEYGYNVTNLEDATYYSEEEAKKIRSIAENGYWGTEDGFGSLDEIKAELLAAGVLTEEELDSLTDGAALTATQMAIWSCSNKMSGIDFVNAHYSNWGTGNVPADKEDEVKVMFKYYEYLMGLAPTEPEGTTQDTIINEKNFIKDVSITVIHKNMYHINNWDNNPENDAYTTNLSFTLVVKPGENNYDDDPNNDDDLIVQVLDENGNTIAVGRIAGTPQPGEDKLISDGNGNYTFENITLVEGDKTFNITLSGVQHLEHGVYLYTSEIKDDLSSQTMVGVASGTYGVNVSMDINFSLNVQDEIVVTQRVWNSEDEPEEPEEDPRYPENDPKKPDDEVDIPDEEVPTTEEPDDTEIPDEDVPLVDIPDEDVPLVDIPDEDVPLADVPKTGDTSFVWAAISLMSGTGLLGLAFAGKKKDEK